jgi:1-phosphofructokinase
MIVTVTINPAIDQTIGIPDFKVGQVNRVQSSQLNAGGKGINVAAFLADFGLPVTATGFLGADNDEIFCRTFAHKGITDCCLRIAGKTRIGLKIVDESARQTTDINFPGEQPTSQDIQHLFEVLSDLSQAGEWFVISGSIPSGVSAGIYAEMIQSLSGKKVVLDTSGEGLRQAVQAGPWMIKPNLEELQELVGERLETPLAVRQAAAELIQQYGIHSVVVSLGKDGAVFVEKEKTLWAMPPETTVLSTVGAGDALVAGTIAGQLRGYDLEDCARLATAFSLSAVTHIGAGLPSLEQVWAEMEQVAIRQA